MKFGLYINNLKSWEFGKASARSLIQQSGAEAAQLKRIGRCKRNQNSEYPAQPKTNYSSCLCIFAIATLVTLTSCLYKMPSDDCISTLPNTNNPNVTREKPSSFIPGRG